MTALFYTILSILEFFLIFGYIWTKYESIWKVLMC